MGRRGTTEAEGVMDRDSYRALGEDVETVELSYHSRVSPGLAVTGFELEQGIGAPSPRWEIWTFLHLAAVQSAKVFRQDLVPGLPLVLQNVLILRHAVNLCMSSRAVSLFS